MLRVGDKVQIKFPKYDILGNPWYKKYNGMITYIHSINDTMLSKLKYYHLYIEDAYLAWPETYLISITSHFICLELEM